MNEQTEERLSKRNLYAFSFGTVGRDMAYTLFSGYIMSFILFTRVLTAQQFSVITALIIVARIIDAMNDPLMGGIIENTRTKWGKFKPWIMIGVVTNAAVLIMLFFSKLQGWDFIYLLIAVYILFDITFTMNDIGYWAMMPSLTSHPEDRNRLASLATLCAGIGAALATAAIPTFTAGDMQLGNGGAATAYKWITAIIVFFFIGCQIMTSVLVKEKPLPPFEKQPHFSFKKVFRVVRKNDQLLWISIVFLINNVAQSVLTGGLAMMYIYFNFGYQGFLYMVYSILFGAAGLFVMMTYPKFSGKYSRKQLMKAGMVLIIIGHGLLALSGLLMPVGLGSIGNLDLKFIALMICNAIYGGGQILIYMVLTISITNTVEYNEWKTGDREESIIFALRPLTAKFGSALMQLVIWLVYLGIGILNNTNGIAVAEQNADQGLYLRAAEGYSALELFTEYGAKDMAEATRLFDRAQELLAVGDKKVVDIADILKSEIIEGVIEGVKNGQKIALVICMAVIPVVLALCAYFMYKSKYFIDEKKYDEMLADIKAKAEATASASAEQ